MGKEYLLSECCHSCIVAGAAVRHLSKEVFYPKGWIRYWDGELSEDDLKIPHSQEAVELDVANKEILMWGFSTKGDVIIAFKKTDVCDFVKGNPKSLLPPKLLPGEDALEYLKRTT